MNTFRLVWGALTRRKPRTAFTFLSVMVAFMLFCVLAAVRYGMQGQLTIAAAQRLDTVNKIFPFAPQPLSYYDKIVTVPGVTAVTYVTGLVGFYKDPENTFPVQWFSPTAFEVIPELILPAKQLQAWQTDRQGVIAGPDLAHRMGWKVGDSIPVQSKVPQKDGSATWYFNLLGIYDADLPEAYQDLFIAHYAYFNEGVANTQRHDVVTHYIERIDDPRNATRISIAIDARFADSSPQTLTQPEILETVTQIRQFGNITAIVIYVGLAVFFSLLLIVSNTLAQSVQERTAEFAVFRVLGFGRAWMILLVLQESLALIVSGGILGLILGYFVTRLLYARVENLLQTFGMTWNAAGVGILLSIGFAIAATVIPMQRVMRLRVAEALRKI